MLLNSEVMKFSMVMILGGLFRLVCHERLDPPGLCLIPLCDRDSGLAACATSLTLGTAFVLLAAAARCVLGGVHWSISPE